MPVGGYLKVATLGFLALAVFCAIPQVDLALSAVFYDASLPRAWYYEELQPWRWLYVYGEYPALCMAGGALACLLASCFWGPWPGTRRRCAFLLIAVLLGPGLLVNGLLKPLWDRPRPRQIEQFGGVKGYRPLWLPGGPKAGESFPSGHAAMGYVLVAGALVMPYRRPWQPKAALLGALGFGTLLGVTRVVQGGHFASDVFCAGWLMCGMVILLQRVFPAAPDGRSPAGDLPNV